MIGIELLNPTVSIEFPPHVFTHPSFGLAMRTYVLDIMNYLVELHAQVRSVAEGILERILNAVLEALANEALNCFRQVKRFGTGGLLMVSDFSGFFVFI